MTYRPVPVREQLALAADHRPPQLDLDHQALPRRQRSPGTGPGRQPPPADAVQVVRRRRCADSLEYRRGDVEVDDGRVHDRPGSDRRGEAGHERDPRPALIHLVLCELPVVQTGDHQRRVLCAHSDLLQMRLPTRGPVLQRCRLLLRACIAVLVVTMVGTASRIRS